MKTGGELAVDRGTRESVDGQLLTVNKDYESYGVLG